MALKSGNLGDEMCIAEKKLGVEHLPPAQAMGVTMGGSISPAYPYLHLDAEKVLDKMGKYGKYQMFIYGMASLAYFLFAAETMVMSLIAVQPDFSCQLNDNGAANAFKVLDQCTILDHNTKTNLECGNGPESRFVYNESEQHITLPVNFDLVCSKEHYTQHGTSLFMIGGMVTTPILIQLADRYGRKFSFLIPLWLTVLANIAVALSPTYYYFLFFRFLAGLGTAGIGTIGFVIMIEAVAPSFRSITPLFSTFVWVSGYMGVGFLHLFISNWRWLYFAISAPGLLTFAFYWFLPESLHWLIANKKTTQVSKYIKHSARMNKVEIMLHECQQDISTSPTAATLESGGEERRVASRTFFDMFKSPALLFHFVLHSYIMMTMNATYWALSLFSTDLHEDEMIGYFLSGAVEIPAGFLAIALLLCFGRRTVTFFALLAQSISMFVAVLFPGKTYFTMTFPLLAKVFNSVAWSSEPLLVGEMSPTSLRNVFYGSVGFFGEIGSILAPYLNILKSFHESAPPLLISVMSFIAALAVLCSPETKNKSMPQDIPDFDPGPVYKTVRRFVTCVTALCSRLFACMGRIFCAKKSQDEPSNESDRSGEGDLSTVSSPESTKAVSLKILHKLQSSFPNPTTDLGENQTSAGSGTTDEFFEVN